jgi:hypothetical protein
MARVETRYQSALQRKVAATLIYEAKQKEYEAACWMGLVPTEARSNVLSAMDAVLDATKEQIDALKGTGLEGNGAMMNAELARQHAEHLARLRRMAAADIQ